MLKPWNVVRVVGKCRSEAGREAGRCRSRVGAPNTGTRSFRTGRKRGPVPLVPGESFRRLAPLLATPRLWDLHGPVGRNGGKAIDWCRLWYAAGGLRHDQARAVRAMCCVASYALAEGVGVCACYEQKK